MSLAVTKSLLLLTLTTGVTAHNGFRTLRTRSNKTMSLMRGQDPTFPYDPSTSEYCVWWYDHSDPDIECAMMPEFWGITDAQWKRWNPSLGNDCSNFPLETSYCVDATGEPSPPPSTTTTAPPETTTSPGNGIETPEPIQPGMVDNCDEFYFVVSGDSCASIISDHGLTTAQFVSWNRDVGGASCTSLWLDTYVCVSIIGHTPTPTDPGNGIETPEPIQPGMVDNCDDFYLVESGDSCASIARDHGISQTQFVNWNEGVGGTACTGLWLDTYVCISIIGHTPTPTDPGNGIETPEPFQTGMVGNCDAFHLVKTGETCATIAQGNGISVSQLTNWNKDFGSECRGMWANAYACVSIVGHTPTPTDPGNGIETPLPIQSGMTKSCDKFHFVKTNQGCAAIVSQYGITLANFYKWNPAVGSDCRGMWSNTYACVGVI